MLSIIFFILKNVTYTDRSSLNTMLFVDKTLFSKLKVIELKITPLGSRSDGLAIKTSANKIIVFKIQTTIRTEFMEIFHKRLNWHRSWKLYGFTVPV